jgi:hypothetical protein
MIHENLYDTILINPHKTQKADALYIVSGYGSATFAKRHIVKLKSVRPIGSINLIIGMPSNRSDHAAFISLHKEYTGIFNGYYLNAPPPVHSKVYAWYSSNQPLIGYSGSGNYSQYGFIGSQQVNQFVADSPVDIKNFFDSLISRCIPIPHAKISNPAGHASYALPRSVPAGQIYWEIPDTRVTISFLDKSGDLPQISGLNWGQRSGRNSNEAYLGIKADARKEGFLPDKGFTFTLLTDDGISLDCVVAQEGRKAIETTYDNSILGKYFRKRLNMSSGELVKKDDLVKYGRTDFTIEKINGETFILDFSKRKK